MIENNSCLDDIHQERKKEKEKKRAYTDDVLDCYVNVYAYIHGCYVFHLLS